MNETPRSGGPTGPQDENVRLAGWLQQILHVAPREKTKTALPGESDHQLELMLESDYHLHFYQQLPDFIMALLSNDEQTPLRSPEPQASGADALVSGIRDFPATIRYAPLLYHLAGCQECHSAYLDLYDSLKEALYPQGRRPLLGQGTRTLEATPQRMLGHLCQTLISQAEAVLRQARREHSDGETSARALLQLALHISARINQGNIRRYALHDLVRVASAASGTAPSGGQEPPEDDSHVYQYTPATAGAGARRGRKVVRRADVLTRYSHQELPVIYLQARSLTGTITQQGEMLELHLHDLDTVLRGHHVLVSVPLGSLLEPIRWIGGNPRAIRSAMKVDEAGSVTVPLGRTDLRMEKLEDRNLLEAMFMLLEVRRADEWNRAS